ncbi:MAG: GNAT family N-acetyltransferase [Desulfuromonadales bacterium]|nr:GNAT family N-acetyltransferase [Desulfuromonadales bacterium]MBN2792369.1 GNAT family N-acetyltransferase [Desulfuromonadales bacterium]
MLNALELFHYADKFRSHLFTVVLEDCSAIEELMLDIHMLNASHIRTLIIHPTNQDAVDTFTLWQQRGFPFRHYSNMAPQEVREGSDFFIDTTSVPVCELNLESCQEPYALTRAALLIAENIGADKIFFLGQEKGLFMGDRFLSHLHPEVLGKYLQEGNSFNIATDKLELLMQASGRSGVEVVLVNSDMGSLFEEIFTHRGSGTLVTSDYPNIIRRGRKSDLRDLFMLIKHEMLTGSILPLSEETLADNIGNYFVFTVNDSIVAAATLIDYGPAAELAKFCTLPRYQGKGRAMQLAKSMIKTALEQKKDYVFALSINEKMWTFFKNLGFSEVDRMELPQSWQDQYDFTRPSKAFRLKL